MFTLQIGYHFFLNMNSVPVYIICVKVPQSERLRIEATDQKAIKTPNQTQPVLIHTGKGGGGELERR
jgi:hypothetical protein